MSRGSWWAVVDAGPAPVDTLEVVALCHVVGVVREPFGVAPDLRRFQGLS
jgi:hypothetical protein